MGFSAASHLGGERYESGWAEAVHSTNFRFYWFVAPELVSSKIPANHHLLPLNPQRGWKRIFQEAKALHTLAQKETVHIFRFHSVQYGMPVALLLRLWGWRTPILFQHLHVEEPRWRYRLWVRLLSLVGCHFACISQAALEDLVQLGVPRSRCFFVQTILLGWQNSLTNSAAKDSSTAFDIAYVGGLIARKRPELVIETATELAKLTGKEIKVAIIGKGPLLEKLQAAAQNSPAKFSFFPHCSDEEKWSILKKSKIFLFPSSQEGFGYAPLEAALAGLWVLSSAAGSLPEVLEGFANATVVSESKFTPFYLATIAQDFLRHPAPSVPETLVQKWTQKSAWTTGHSSVILSLALKAGTHEKSSH